MEGRKVGTPASRDVGGKDKREGSWKSEVIEYLKKNPKIMKMSIEELEGKTAKKVYGGELEMSPIPKQLVVGQEPENMSQESEYVDYENMIYSSVMDKLPQTDLLIPTNNKNQQDSMNALYGMMDEYANDTEMRYYAKCKFVMDGKDRFEFGTSLFGI